MSINENNENKENNINEPNTLKIVFVFRNALFKLLGTIKLNYNFYPAVQQNLNIIIQKIEELLLSLYKPDNNIEIKLFELFYLFISVNTNSTFYELFLNFLEKFIKKLCKLDKYLVNMHLLKFQNYYLLLYSSLINKKFDYVGVQSDFNATFNIAICLSELVELFYEQKINHTKIKPTELFQFFLETNINLFNLSRNNIYFSSEKFNNVLIKTFKNIFNDFSYAKETMNIVEIILDKIILISKIKDDEYNKIDDYEESFHVDTLLLCLKLICKVLKNKNLCKLFSYNFKLKLIKGLIELSYWDNPNMVDYTCKILLLIFNLSTTVEEFSMRKEIEKLFDFIYLRHFKSYYFYLEDKNEKIKKSEKLNKISVLEILIKNFNYFIEKNDFLAMIYLINDVYKIRFNVISEILNAIQKYFILDDTKYIYLKNNFIITYQIVFKKILEYFNRNDSNDNYKYSFYNKIEEFSDYWVHKIKLIKEGNFKELLKVFCKEYNIIELKKNEKFETLDEKNQNIYKMLAKSVAILIRYSNYVNIDNLYEILADNHPFSKLILNEYVKTYNFKGYNIIKAYNLFLSTFKLTGESYNIYNFICAFGAKYYEDNKLIFEKNKNDKNLISFKSDEEVTSFAYSIMILNTDLHNQNVQNKMTLEEFIKNNKSSGLFTDVPEEYFKEIYQEIRENGLKKANQRSENYSKDNDIYSDLKSLQLYTSVYQDLFFYRDNSIFDIFSDNNYNLTKENYPYLNLFNKIIIRDDKKNSYWLNYVYNNLFDELLPLIISLPQNVFENNTEFVMELIEKICDISLKLNRKEIIDKIIVCLNSLLNNKNINIYNLFFKTVLKYCKDFHTHLEMFYKAILDLLNFNLREENNPLHNEYESIIEDLIIKSFQVISSKRRDKNEGVGFFNLLIFGESNTQKELTFADYKEKIYEQIKFNIIYKSSGKLPVVKSRSTENLNSNIKDELEIDKEKTESFSSTNNIIISENTVNKNENISNEEEMAKILFNTEKNDNEYKINYMNKLIDVKMILTKIKMQEEEFIFFVTFAASKILEYQNENEIFISLIFLNEILKDISDNQFGKIWPNLFNIFKSKMEFKKVDDDNIFEILFVNFFLTQIVNKYFKNVLNEDYEQLLDTYEEIGSVELLLIILNFNDFFIKSAIQSNKNLSPQNFDSLIFLLYKLFLQLSKNLCNLKENDMLNTKNGLTTLNQINQTINLFNSIISAIRSNDIISFDCISRISNIVKIIYDNNILKIFYEMKYKVLNISALISTLSKIIYEAMINSIKEIKLLEKDSPEIIESKKNSEFYSNFFIYLSQFTLKCSLIEDEEIQKIFFEKINFFTSKQIPKGKCSQVINILNEWYPNFVKLQIKYNNFWKDVISLFHALFENNPEVQKDTSNIEAIWSLLIKKYLIALNDEWKKKKLGEPVEELAIVKKIYIIVRNIVNKITNSQKLGWFESTKNTIKLYFPGVIED